MTSDGFVANLSLKLSDAWVILREIISPHRSMQKTQIKQMLRSWGWQEGSLKNGRKIWQSSRRMCCWQPVLPLTHLTAWRFLCGGFQWMWLSSPPQENNIVNWLLPKVVCVHELLPYQEAPFSTMCSENHQQSIFLSRGKRWQRVSWWITNSKLHMIWNSSWFKIVRGFSDLGTIWLLIEK